MKARQIATALDSVYALDLRHRIRAIERGPDGLWGSWQDTGGEARRIVHEGDIVARIGLDHQVWALQRSPRLPWFSLGLEATDLTATRIPGGAPVLFASDSDQSVWHTWKPTPASSWAEWGPLAGPASNLVADVIPTGGLVLFGTRDGAVYHRWQDQPLGPWKEWTPIEGPPDGARALGLSPIPGGGLALFALGSDNGLYYRWQDKPFGGWQAWEPLGTRIGSISITRGRAGGLAVFALAMDGVLRYRCQAKPFGEWGPWIDLDGAGKSLAAQPSYTDGLEVFAIGPDDEVYHKWCERLDEPWTDWMLLDHETSPLRVGRNTGWPFRAPMKPWSSDASNGSVGDLTLAARPGRGVLSHSNSYSPRRGPQLMGEQGLTYSAGQSERPAAGYTVLVVDDEEAVRRLACRMLTWTGYQALEARHGREALATIEQHAGPIHLILTDIKMPGMSGRELGRLIEKRWPGKRILYMSGFASEVFQGGLLEPGAPFLAKPFTQDDLAAKVKAVLEGE